MNPQARRILNELRVLSRSQDYLANARAELASNPHDDRLRAFVALVENVMEQERRRLMGEAYAAPAVAAAR